MNISNHETWTRRGGATVSGYKRLGPLSIASLLSVSLAVPPGVRAFQHSEGERQAVQVLDKRRMLLEPIIDAKEGAAVAALLVVLPQRSVATGEKITGEERYFLKECRFLKDTKSDKPQESIEEERKRPSSNLAEARARYSEARGRYSRALKILIAHGEEDLISEGTTDNPPVTRVRTKKPSPATILYLREGIEALRKSAEGGYPDALAVLGLMTLNGGEDVRRDLREGTRLMLEAAAKGHLDAQRWAGMQYAGLVPDPILTFDCERAVFWLSKAAEKGGEAERTVVMGLKLTQCLVK